MTLKAMFKLFDGYSATADKVEKKTEKATNKILQASGATDKFNKKLEATGTSANKGSSGLGKFLSIAAMIAGAVKGANIADEYTNTASRLNMVNDGLQTQSELQDKIFAAADRAKGSYTDMASAVSKLGLLAGDAFSSNDETIAFTELMQKSFKVGGASQQEQSSGMYQLTQAMASGKLQGDEFRSIMENAPLLADAIAKYTGKTKGQLKEMSSQGTITADIIKNALFAAGDDINAKFEEMPYTFADIWNKIKNGGISAFSGLIEKINKLINTGQFMSFVDGLIAGFSMVADAIGNIIDFVIDNWPAIKTILEIVAVVYMAVIIAKIWETVTALAAQAAAWVMAYWPVLLVIGAIILLIAVIYKIVDVINTVTGSTISATGVILGALAWLGALIWNLFLGLVENILGMVEYMVNPFLVFANFIGNLFVDPISAVIYLFQGLADTVLGLLQKIASAMDMVFGSNMADTVAGWRSGLKAMADEAVKARGYDPKDFNTDLLDLGVEDLGLKRIDMTDAYDGGYGLGEKIDNKLSGLIDSLTSEEDKGTEYKPTVVEGTGSKGNVKVSMDKEDIGYLRDLAEREFVNKFSTATLAPKITVKFTGAISKEADTDAMYSRIGRILQEQIAVAAEGVY